MRIWNFKYVDYIYFLNLDITLIFVLMDDVFETDVFMSL